MSDTPKDTRSYLGFQKKALEAELLALHPKLMKEYIYVTESLHAIDKLGSKLDISSTEFMPYPDACDAIEAYLDQVKEFTDREKVIQALLDGGWQPLNKVRRKSIVDSINYNSNPKRSKKPRLAIKDDKIGRVAWIKSEGTSGSPPGIATKHPKDHHE